MVDTAAADHLLVGSGPADCRNRGVGSHACGHQCSRDDAALGNAHQHHDGATGLRQRCPVHRLLAVLAMPGDHGEHRRQRTVRDGNPRCRGCGNRRGDARHDVAGNALGDQSGSFLAATTEHERVAALEPHHPTTLSGETHEQHVDEVLGDALPRTLTDIDQLGARRHQRQHIAADERVVHHHVGLGQQSRRFQREQFRVTGARAHERDTTQRTCRHRTHHGFGHGITDVIIAAPAVEFVASSMRIIRPPTGLST